MKSKHLTTGNAGRPVAAGFTLVELMIVVAIATILVSVAIPSYQAYVQKSRRTEARSALMDLAGREERWFSSNNAYTNVPANLGYGTFTPVGSGYYNITIPPPTAAAPGNPPTQAGYTITATATGIQANDTICTSFTVDQTGTQTSTGTGTVQTCWQ